jgi:hypothetical protein
MYSLKITREHSGMEGTYDTLEDAIERLKNYSTVFGGDIIEVSITKN